MGAQHPEQFKLFYMFAYDYNRKEGQKVVGRVPAFGAGGAKTNGHHTVGAGPPQRAVAGTVSDARARMLGFAAATRRVAIRRGMAPHRHRDWPHIGTGTTWPHLR
jgi:hypothetical protein